MSSFFKQPQKSHHKTKTALRSFSLIFCSLALSIILAVNIACASDLPHAAGSPIAGINFDDRPLLLPIQRNFQMAMLTASTELGRTCGKMEAYGWRMNPDEQDRVNQIFNNTVDRLRAQGFVIEAKSPASVSRDVTLFTADRPDKHLVFMWSAGEIGLVMVLCETSAPLPSTPNVLKPPSEMFQPSSNNLREGVYSKLASNAPISLTRTGKKLVEDFSPLGDWVGTYTCQQGTTGGTLHISSLKGDQFEGIFRFYPTPKNPYVPSGKYTVFGEYDRDSYRILINPGKWIERPKNYYNTIIIGSFDPVAKTFSGYFQGINGCTSFEARYVPEGDSIKSETKKTTQKSVKLTRKKAVNNTKKKAKAKQQELKQKTEADSGSVMATEKKPQEADSSSDGDKLKAEQNEAELKAEKKSKSAEAKEKQGEKKLEPDKIPLPPKPPATEEVPGIRLE